MGLIKVKLEQLRNIDLKREFKMRPQFRYIQTRYFQVTFQISTSSDQVLPSEYWTEFNEDSD